MAEDLATDSPGLEPPVTGNATVDAVVDGLRDLGERPLAEHVEAFEDAHARLRTALNGDSSTTSG